MPGFGTVVGVREFNMAAAESEFADGIDQEQREGIPLNLWRCLPDSPDSLVWVNVYTGPDTPPERVKMRKGDYDALPRA
ncbi:hypothetical protein [Rhodococcoides yunnanense]|uniref:hypothetical protein n=1 Tax=Rhodococcoides yunnanense TaxID=278209 RepID=UPI000932AA25|nr:hypothetical protein [Rhodococcus yunnanensis]